MIGKRVLTTVLVLLALLAVPFGGPSAGQVAGQTQGPQSPEGAYSYAFTYQGQLKGPGGPINGTCDLRFILWNAASGGATVGNPVLIEGRELVDGLFTARLDFGGMEAHHGSARWLEVDVRCPTGVGGYVALQPRQELTAAPAALSLALPFRAEANVGGPLVTFWNSGDGEAALFGSALGFGLWVESAGLDGLYVSSAGQDGAHVVSAGGRGLAVETAGGDGVFVNTAHGSGLHVSSADLHGLEVDTVSGDGVSVVSAGGRGLAVEAAGGDGVSVFRAGNPSGSVWTGYHNGVEVAGAEGHGLFVGRADEAGVYVNSARTGVVVSAVDTAGGEGTGMFVGQARWGLWLENVIQDGIYVKNAGNGLYVNTATYEGVAVGHAGASGVLVNQAGSPSSAVTSPQPNGVEVAGAQGYGLYVGRADLDGVYVNSTAWHGLNVAGAGVDGLYVSAANNDGVDVTGSAYAGNFRGNINVSGDCYGCTTAVFGRNAGRQPLEPGDIVAIEGVEATTLDNAPALWRVVPAGEGSASVGVVRGRAELDEAPEGATLRQGETGQRLVPRDGAAQPGDYLTIVIYGPMQVRASAADGPIGPGTRLAVGQAGAARALKTAVVEGLTLAESAPTIGIALAAPDEDGLVWVLVNPQ